MPPQSTLRRAIEVIDAGGAALALVVEASGVLIGTLTDGDIRRALLAGATLDGSIEPFVRNDFVAAPAGGNRAAALDLMQARGISQLPILDAEGHLIGLHLLRELVGTEERPNAAVVMAGGRGTRLRPLTASVPKPMVEVAGRPILERIVLHLVGSGVRRVFLAVNYLADAIEAHFTDGSALGCTIEYLREQPDRPLGTAGALRLLPDAVVGSEHPLLVMNGDLLTAFPVASMLASHQEQGDAVTVGVTTYSHQVPFGVTAINAGRVTALDEKPTVTWTVNAGIYVVEPSLLTRIPAGVEYFMTQLIDRCLAAGERVGIHPVGPDWDDVGRLADLRRVRGEGD